MYRGRKDGSKKFGLGRRSTEEDEIEYMPSAAMKSRPSMVVQGDIVASRKAAKLAQIREVCRLYL